MLIAEPLEFRLPPAPLGEAAYWDPTFASLFWVNITRHRSHVLDVKYGELSPLPAPIPPAAHLAAKSLTLFITPASDGKDEDALRRFPYSSQIFAGVLGARGFASPCPVGIAGFAKSEDAS